MLRTPNLSQLQRFDNSKQNSDNASEIKKKEDAASKQDQSKFENSAKQYNADNQHIDEGIEADFARLSLQRDTTLPALNANKKDSKNDSIDQKRIQSIKESLLRDKSTTSKK